MSEADLDRELGETYFKLDTALIENQKLRAENERLRKENGSTYCAYCGAEYYRENASIAEIRDHIKVCEHHPMRKLEAENERLTAELSGKTGELEELKNGIAFYIEAGKVLSDEIKSWKISIADVRTKFLESQRVVGELTAERDRYKAALENAILYLDDAWRHATHPNASAKQVGEDISAIVSGIEEALRGADDNEVQP